tara:strand:+ start:24440 stop:25486 length:1047 start_codon:yes stop_codon:yes gene_type:complete
MNNVVADRVEGDLGKWLKREQRFQKIFPRPLASNRSFLREKLKYYRTLDSRYGNMANQEERTTLRLVREDRKAIERQLYPNAFVRLAYRAYSRIQNEAEKRQDKRRNEANLEGLRATALRLGFPEDALIKGQSEGRSENLGQDIPFSYQIAANERMAFHWDLTGEDGSYMLNGYRATLSKEGDPDRSHNFDFNGTDGITGAQAYNLLSGRSVEIGKEGNRHWIKLDLNDKNRDGNFNVRRFYPKYGFDLEKCLERLPIKQLKDPDCTKELLLDLKNGQRRQVTFLSGDIQKRISVEANPHFRSLNFYNGNGKKISYSKALRSARTKKTSHQNNLRSKANGPIKNGLRI